MRLRRPIMDEPTAVDRKDKLAQLIRRQARRRGRKNLRRHIVRPFRVTPKPKRPAHYVNPRLAGLPGKNRREKQANARAAQQAWLADKRRRSAA
jgi:hypothetical protein